MKDIILSDTKIYTSYFAVVNQYTSFDKQISVSLSSPKWFKGGHYNILTPSWNLLKQYKNGYIDELNYENQYYNDILNRLNPNIVYNDLKGKVICCWERSDSFCHRHIIIKWLKEHLGDNVSGGELN